MDTIEIKEYPVHSYNKLFCLTLNRLYPTYRKSFGTVAFSMMQACIKDHTISSLLLRGCLVSKTFMHCLNQS